MVRLIARMIEPRRLGAALAALLVLAAGALPAAGQDERPGVFGEVIDVRVVNIEVVVEDKDGVRVSGLAATDFELLVDGKVVPIEYFTEVLGGSAVVREGAPGASTLPALAPGELVGTSYLVFIDDNFSIRADRNQVLEKMRDQLPFLNPEDRMAVVAFNGKRLEMLSTWTQSVSALERVFRDAMERKSNGLKLRSEWRALASTGSFRDTDAVLGPAAFRNQLDLEEEALAERIAEQVRRTVMAGAAALRGFANPPGRKVMLLLSGGWPSNPAQWVVDDTSRVITDQRIPSGDDLYQPLVETANRLSYSLYPVDVPGLEAETVRAEQFTVDFAAPTAVGLQRERELDQHASLQQLAKQTGGQAFLNAAGRNALERAVLDTRSYYWIGFTPSWKGDNESHDVRVRPLQKGLDVRSRRSFSDLSRETEVTMMVESALLFGNPASAAPLGARLGEPKKAGIGKVEVPIDVIIPVNELTFLPQQNGFVAQAELRFAVLDDKGNMADIPVIPLVMQSERLPAEGDLTRYQTSLKMRKRSHDLVISLYDVATGKILSTKLEVDPQ